VVPDEEEVTLVVESDDLPSLELGLVVGKQAPQETPRPVPQARAETVENKLRHVVR